MAAAYVELQQYLTTAQKFLTTADQLISNPSPSNEDQVELHLSIFERYVPKIEKFRPTAKAKDEVEFAEKAVPILDQIFITQIQLENVRDKFKKDSDPTPSDNSRTPSNPNLPRLKIQKFDGTKKEEYRTFIKTFQAIFHVEPDFTIRFIHLKQHVTGEAAEHISRLPINDSSYEKAIEILNEKYDDTKVIIADLYRNIHVLPPVMEENTGKLRSLFNKVEANLRALEQYGEKIDDNVYLHNQIYQKFPPTIIFSLSQQTQLTLSSFRTKMEELLKIRENHEAMSMAFNPKPSIHQSPFAALTVTGFNDPSKKSNVNTRNESPPNPPANETPNLDLKKSEKEKRSRNDREKRPVTCSFCKNSHYSDKCTLFSTYEERIKKIPDRCHVCLYNHTTQECRSASRCFYCKGKHHSSLCQKKFSAASSSSSTNNDGKTNLFVSSKGTYLTASKVQIRNKENGLVIHVRVIIDPGCPSSLITNTVADLLRLEQSTKQKIPVKGFLDETPKMLETATVTFEIISSENNEVKTVTASTTPFIAKNISSIKPNDFISSHPEYEHMNFATIINEEEPTLLIGADYTFSFLADQPKITVKEDLHLIHSKFGWMISGPVSSIANTHPQSYLLTTAAAVDQLWSLDTVGIKETDISTTEEQECALKQFYDTITFEDGRYNVGFPWRHDPETLPSNFGLAYAQLQHLYKKLPINLIRAYDDILRQQICNGIIEEVPKDDKATQVHYLPHHAVLQPEKSTPLRIVHNGSAKTKGSRSLNESIYKGISFLQDMVKIIIRFRLHKIPIIADIEKAYHMIGLRDHDRDMVRFLWIKNPHHNLTKDNILILRFCRFPFGIIASGFVLDATIMHHIQKNPNKFSKQLKRDKYVDNFVSGTSSEAEAIELIETAIALFQKCQMNLRQWTTTSNTVRAAIPKNIQLNKESTSLFGLTWNIERDILQITPPKFFEGFVTLKTILQNTSKVYDPLGLVSPIILRAKLLMRKLREEEKLLNEKISDDKVLQEWSSIQNDFNRIPELEFQRKINTSPFTEIHTFSDASAKGYGFIIYARTPYPTHTTIYPLFAKARITPPRKISTPKLELLAASLSATATQFVLEALQPLIKPKLIYLWTDFKCTLDRIYGTKILAPYIENRIKLIRSVPNLKARFVPGKQNPADIASRSATYEELNASSWFTGPKFLQHPESTWPAMKIDETTSDEIEVEENPPDTILNIVHDSREILAINIQNFNSFRKLLLVTKFTLQLLVNKSKKFREKFGLSEQLSLHSALIFWIRHVQR